MEAFEQVVYEALYEVMEQAWERTEADFQAQRAAAGEASDHA
jgi:hypothetical protein